MFESQNIKDYIAKAVVLKDELSREIEYKDKFAKFTLLFPSIEDKMVCKAIFDMMFTSEISSRKFISQMVDGVNSLVPQKISEMVDIYNQAVVLINKKMDLDNKKATDSGGERFTTEAKQGSSKYDEKHGRESDPFIVMSSQDPNRSDNLSQMLINKGDKGVTLVTKSELDLAKIENDNLQRIKQQKERLQSEEEARKAYERSLAERRNKKDYAQVAGELQRVYNNIHDD